MSSDLNVIEHLTAASRFRTQTRLAKAAGVQPHTITEKKHNNSLTHAQMRRILQAAPDMGVEITPADFFPEFVSDAPSDGTATRSPKRKRAT